VGAFAGWDSRKVLVNIQVNENYLDTYIYANFMRRNLLIRIPLAWKIAEQLSGLLSNVLSAYTNSWRFRGHYLRLDAFHTDILGLERKHLHDSWPESLAIPFSTKTIRLKKLNLIHHKNRHSQSNFNNGRLIANCLVCYASLVWFLGLASIIAAGNMYVGCTLRRMAK